MTIAWCFEDQATAYTDSVLGAFAYSSAVVPSLWPLEVANVLLVNERRRKLAKADSEAFLGLLVSLPITVDAEMAQHAWGGALSLAWARDLSAYDGAYLELAARLGLPLATMDHHLRRAAAGAGIALVS